MSFVTPAVVRLVVLALCAALLVVEHVRLAIRAHKKGEPGRVVLGLCVPFAGAWMAWREGARVAPVVYAVLAALYLGLRFAG